MIQANPLTHTLGIDVSLDAQRLIKDDLLIDAESDEQEIIK